MYEHIAVNLKTMQNVIALLFLFTSGILGLGIQLLLLVVNLYLLNLEVIALNTCLTFTFLCLRPN